MKTRSQPLPEDQLTKEQLRTTVMIREGKNAGRTVMLATIGIFVAGYILFPFFWMVKSSVQPLGEITAIPAVWIPKNPTLDGYEQALNLIPFMRYAFNSFFTSTATTLLTLIVGCPAAYVLSRYQFPGATLILFSILFTQLIPDITRVFPVYFLIQDLGLLNSYLGLIVAQAGFAVPFAVMILQAYFRSSYPRELEEAALTDGDTWFSAFIHIVLPIAIPGLVAIGTFVFLNSWNDFLWPSILLNTGDMKTLQVGIRDFVGEMGSLQRVNAFMAACLMTTIPVLILFRFIQGQMVGGLSSGALKG
jgi:multiple sugar transport system permease protein